jgi:hypothetical protein
MTKTDVLPSAVLIHLADALSVPDGGFSVAVASWSDVRAGFAVSAIPECEQQLAGPVTHEDIEHYVSDHAAMLARHDVVLGGWRSPDNGLAYLDVSIVVRSRRQALALAREHDQLAIWDFAHSQSVPIVSSGTGPRSVSRLSGLVMGCRAG